MAYIIIGIVVLLFVRWLSWLGKEVFGEEVDYCHHDNLKPPKEDT